MMKWKSFWVSLKVYLMIDMRDSFTHNEYLNSVDNFKSSFDEKKLNCDDYWSIFTKLQIKISHNKCPICEVELVSIPNKTNTATLDHFKPKAEDKYPELKCEPKNYLLMCSLCNNTYKKDEFPLFESKPLLFNPTKESPLDYFELAFRYSPKGGILELKRKPNISKDSHKYKVCEKMIKLFGLGYCHKDIHPNDKPNKNTKECRVDILTKHYSTFIELAKAINSKNKKAYALILRNKNKKKELEKYGFYNFIMQKQFTIN